MLLPQFLRSQPGAFHQRHFAKIQDPKDLFYVSEKTDGVRVLMLISDGQLFLRSDKYLYCIEAR